MYRFKVDKMGGGCCAKWVTRAVLSIEPDARVEVDFSAKLVTVSGTASVTDRIAQAIAGFPG